MPRADYATAARQLTSQRRSTSRTTRKPSGSGSWGPAMDGRPAGHDGLDHRPQIVGQHRVRRFGQHRPPTAVAHADESELIRLSLGPQVPASNTYRWQVAISGRSWIAPLEVGGAGIGHSQRGGVAAAIFVLGSGKAWAGVEEVKVPFPFVVHGTTLPSGTYRIQREGDALEIQGERGNKAAVFVARSRPLGTTRPATNRP